MKQVRQRLDLPWDKWSLASNPTLTVDDIFSLNISDDEWEFDRISSSINMEQVRENIYLIWDRHSLSYNPTLTFDVVKLDLPNAKGKWDWKQISQLLPLSDLYKLPDITWDREYLSRNKHLKISEYSSDIRRNYM